MKIIKIIKNIFIFIGAWFFVSIWLTIFQELTVEELQKGNFGLSGLFRIVSLLPLFVFSYIFVKKIIDWKNTSKKRDLKN